MKKDKQQVGIIHNINLNNGILQPFLQVINNEGLNLGKMSREDALKLAQQSNLDLVIVADENSEGIPVTKIMNYSKKVYEDKKKHNIVKKKSYDTKTKEIRISLKIGKHDLETKLEQSAKLLFVGYRVKVVLIMKGRERSLRDTLGMNVIAKATDLLFEIISKSSAKVLSFEQEVDNNHSICRVFYLKK